VQLLFLLCEFRRTRPGCLPRLFLFLQSRFGVCDTAQLFSFGAHQRLNLGI
jgi:hypothetical protein